MSAELVENSDQRIARLVQLSKLSQGSNLSESEIKEFLKISKEERIPKFRAMANLNAAKFYNSKGEIHKVREYAEKAKLMGDLEGGSKWSPFDANDLAILLSENGNLKA
ncbi:hypothetical protein PGTUg99_018538 [Puccinia graminis f. sp. tritici]|uniref:Uncharacterized protein n=1 Tax=Puccinia graminis f. sp. tritici TaxID=56615 RepID=A0A5B0QHH9_PUCGR|nr:hypothetical protein PGTUg99_018538 [Puccinia graminis f. sp. tritici]